MKMLHDRCDRWMDVSVWLLPWLLLVIHGVPLYLSTRVHVAVLAALWFPEGTTTWDQTLTPWLKE